MLTDFLTFSMLLVGKHSPNREHSEQHAQIWSCEITLAVLRQRCWRANLMLEGVLRMSISPVGCKCKVGITKALLM